MKSITLTQGQTAIVDDEDYEWLSQWKWFADWKPKIHNFYAARKSRVNEPYPTETTILMHRAILGLEPGDKRQADHKEPRNTLDNRRVNLRMATHSQNGHNRHRGRNNTSGVKGVGWRKKERCWEARIKVNGRLLYLGLFQDIASASLAYSQAAEKYHGEFGRTE